MDPDLVRQQEEAELASRKGSAGMRESEAARPVFRAARLSRDHGAAAPERSQEEHEKTEAPPDAKAEGAAVTLPRFSPARAFTGSLAGFAAGGIAGTALGLQIPQILFLASVLAILSGALALTMFNRRPEARS